MASANLTTKDVARLLNISEATVKRWAESGALPSEKTVGGHRRFSIQSIARMRRDQKTEVTSVQSGKRSVSKPLIETGTFLELILGGREIEAAAALIDAYLHHHTLPSIFDTTVTEAMHEVGELWFRGEIGVAEEHLATQVVLNAIDRLRNVVMLADHTGLKAICCGIEGDLHELPIHLAEVILESEGWEVLNLGPNTPLFSLGEMVKQQRPNLICISARAINDLGRAVIEYEQVRKVGGKLGTALVVGGEAFRDVTMRTRFPADFHADDFKSFSKFVRAFTKRQA